MNFVHPVKKTRWFEYVKWKGVLSEAKERFNAAKSDGYRKKMGEVMREGVCSSCGGSRLKPYPAETRLGGKKIGELSGMPLEDILRFFETLKLSSVELKIGEELIKETKERLQNLICFY